MESFLAVGAPDRVQDSASAAVLLRAGGRTCALDVSHVLEIMRPLPVEAVANMPEFVAGLSVIRGDPTPVVLLATLLAGKRETPARFVVVRAGQRKVALAVESVLGTFHLGSAAARGLPPLVENAASGTLQALGALDAELLFVLDSASIVPDEILEEMVPA